MDKQQQQRRSHKAGGTYGQRDIAGAARTADTMTTKAGSLSEANLGEAPRRQATERYGEDDVEGESGFRGRDHLDRAPAPSPDKSPASKP